MAEQLHPFDEQADSSAPTNLPSTTRTIDVGGRQLLVDGWKDGRPPAHAKPTQEIPVVVHFPPGAPPAVSVHGSHVSAVMQHRRAQRFFAAKLNGSDDIDQILKGYQMFCLADYEFDRDMTLGFVDAKHNEEAEVALDLFLDLDDLGRGKLPKTFRLRVPKEGRGSKETLKNVPTAKRVAHAAIAAGVVWRKIIFHPSDKDHVSAAAKFYDEDTRVSLPHETFKWKRIFPNVFEKTAEQEAKLRPYLLNHFQQLALEFIEMQTQSFDDPLCGDAVSAGFFRRLINDLKTVESKGPDARAVYYREEVLPTIVRRIKRGAAY